MIDPDLNDLLSLGGNFILTPNNVQGPDMKSTINGLTRRLILRDYFGNKSDMPPLYPDGNKSWIPFTPFAGIARAMLHPEHFLPLLQCMPVFGNLTRSQFRGLHKYKKLKEESGLDKMITIQADKNMGICIIDQKGYDLRMVNEIKRMSNSFAILPSDGTSDLVTKSLDTKKLILDLIRNNMVNGPYKDPLVKYLQQDNFDQLPIIHGLPKLHKSGERMRLLLPFNKNIFSGIHKFIAKVLQPLAFRETTSLTSSIELVHELEKMENFSGKELVATADLDNMYNNINVPLAIDAVLDRINSNLPEFLVFGPDKVTNERIWRRILTLSLDDMYFRYNDLIIHQVKGVPMGSPFGPVMAVITINYIISLNTIPDTFLFKGMYIDDGFFVFKSGYDRSNVTKCLDELISYPSSELKWDHGSIKVMSVDELAIPDNNDKITFLDLTIKSIRSGSSYSMVSSCYFKPLGTYQYLHWKSSHPKACKRAVISGELTRRMRLSSLVPDYTDACYDLCIKLLSRGYPLAELEVAANKVNYDDRVRMVEKSYSKIVSCRTTFKNPWSTSHIVRMNIAPMILTYDARYHRSIVLIRKRLQELLDNDLYGGGDSFRIVIAYKKGKPFVGG